MRHLGCFRDEADKCLEIAMRAVREGNRDKAEKFVKKAEKLFPSRKIQVEIVMMKCYYD